MVFAKPTDLSLLPAWNIVEDEFRRARTRRISLTDVYGALLSPPVGMKAGAVPVFITAALLAFRDEVAIYEHGTFKPLLTPELSERMVRNPSHFEIKHFATTTGARRIIVEALAAGLRARPGLQEYRVPEVLAIVSHLVSKARRLQTYTLRTRQLNRFALQARDALLAAVEPDELLFQSLPAALGFPPVPSSVSTYPMAGAYADRLCNALTELGGSYDRLLMRLLEFFTETSGEGNRQTLSVQAAAIESDVLNPAMRAFVLTLANDDLDTDSAWIEAVATVVVQKAPAEWSDDDLTRFRLELPQQLAAFQRLVALHAACRANGTASPNGLRVVFTRQDGSEYVRLVGLDAQQRRHATDAFNKTLADLTKLVGSPQQARNALLAILGETVLSEPPDTHSQTPLPQAQERPRNA